jgi:hypothetical protein
MLSQRALQLELDSALHLSLQLALQGVLEGIQMIGLSGRSQTAPSAARKLE